MPLPQKKLRELVLQLLYGYEVEDEPDESMISLIMEEMKITRRYAYQAHDKVKKIRSSLPQLDEVLAKYTEGHSFERMQWMTRNVLRLGIYEMLFEKELPKKVAIVEAVRLCQKFGTPEAASFVNAVLDNLIDDKE